MQVYSFIEAQKQINGTSRHECAIFSVYREISGINHCKSDLHGTFTPLVWASPPCNIEGLLHMSSWKAYQSWLWLSFVVRGWQQQLLNVSIRAHQKFALPPFEYQKHYLFYLRILYCRLWTGLPFLLSVFVLCLSKYKTLLFGSTAVGNVLFFKTHETSTPSHWRGNYT